MKNFFLPVIVLMLVLACGENRQSAVALKVYFDLDSLLDRQVEILSKKEAILTKRVEMDGQKETLAQQPDSAQWESEFVIIRDFNLNKSHYVGAYGTTSGSDYIKYTLEDDINAPVKVFEVFRPEGQVERIVSNYYEDKSIYQHRRNLELTFENGQLSAYQIKGFQKMILKDTIQYTISGKITQ
ncbi:hypothetical protein [Marinoscillum sp.]|uniref:hypothetical protein n=1 Tax=Marinoscillum sp. TaxID=2024838 RepID=UPI003BABF831